MNSELAEQQMAWHHMNAKQEMPHNTIIQVRYTTMISADDGKLRTIIFYHEVSLFH
jgi:hypothetical protein